MKALYGIGFLLLLVSLSVNSSITAQQSQNTTLSDQLLWQVGTGQGLHLTWSDAAANIAVSTTQGIVSFDQELNAVGQFSRSSTLTGQLTWSTDGQYLVSTTDQHIIIQESLSAKVLTSIEQPLIWSLAWRPGFDQFASASTDRDGDVVSLWDALTGEKIATLRDFSSRVIALDWDAEGQYLAIGTRAGDVVIYDVMSDERIQQWHVTGRSIQSISWSPDGRILAVSSSGQAFLTLWDTSSYEQINEQNSPNFTGKIAWQSDSQIIAGQIENGCVGVWNITSKEFFTIDCRTSPVIDFAWHDSWLAMLYRDGQLQIWDSTSNQLLASQQPLTGVIANFSAAPQTDRIAVVYQNANTIHVFNSIDGSEQQTLIPASQVEPSDFSDIAWNADGQKLAVAYHKSVEIWSLEETSEAPLVIEYDGRMPFLAWNPVQTDQLRVSWGEESNRILMSINANTGEIEEQVPIEGLLQLHWRPDAEQMAVYLYTDPTSPENTLADLQILDAQSYQEITTLTFTQMSPTSQFSWLPDGTNLLGIECNRAVGGCNFWTWKENVEDLQHSEPDLPNDALAFAPFALDPTGSYIALGSAASPQVYILQRDSLEILLTLDDFARPPSLITWGNEGQLYVLDGTLRAYQIK